MRIGGFLSTRRVSEILDCTISHVTELARSRKLIPTYRTETGEYRFTWGAVQCYKLGTRGFKAVLELPFLNNIVEEVVERVGSEIAEFFGDEPGCVICTVFELFYGIALSSYLNAKNGDITLVCIGHEVKAWDDENVERRKILLVTSYSVPGRLERMEEALRRRCQATNVEIGEVRSLVYVKHGGNPDYFIVGYEEHLQNIDIQFVA